MHFSLPLLDHTQAQVRESASSIMALIGTKIGEDKIKPLLEKARKSSVQNIFNKIDSARSSVNSKESPKTTSKSVFHQRQYIEVKELSVRREY
jgi:hypothetical protein